MKKVRDHWHQSTLKEWKHSQKHPGKCQSCAPGLQTLRERGESEASIGSKAWRKQSAMKAWLFVFPVVTLKMSTAQKSIPKQTSAFLMQIFLKDRWTKIHNACKSDENRSHKSRKICLSHPQGSVFPKVYSCRSPAFSSPEGFTSLYSYAVFLSSVIQVPEEPQHTWHLQVYPLLQAYQCPLLPAVHSWHPG